MAVTPSLNTNAYNRQTWENAEFPILCQTCLGDNPYIRMTKETYGKECKICARPFTIFRWCPGARMRFKKTEVCQTCAKIKNVCQTCLLDLEYGLPTQVRDKALGLMEQMPESDVGKEYYTQNLEKQLANSDGCNPIGELARTNTKGHELLMKLARTTPHYKRNRAHICSFWVKGDCKRGEECPYRHEMPTDPNDPLSKQNMKDRFHGVNDPVAEKMLARAATMKSLTVPDDKSIMHLFIGGVETPHCTEKDLRDFFYQFGEIRAIKMVPTQKAAFVHFSSRVAAERAADAAFAKLAINGRPLRVMWGRAVGAPMQGGDAALVHTAAVPGLPGPIPVPQLAAAAPDATAARSSAPAAALVGIGNAAGFVGAMIPPGMPAPMVYQPPGMMGPPRGGGGGKGQGQGPPPVHYPSMDPSRMGASRARAEDGPAPKKRR